MFTQTARAGRTRLMRRALVLAVLAAALATAVAGCGGGGDGDTTEASTTTVDDRQRRRGGGQGSLRLRGMRRLSHVLCGRLFGQRWPEPRRRVAVVRPRRDAGHRGRWSDAVVQGRADRAADPGRRRLRLGLVARNSSPGRRPSRLCLRVRVRSGEHCDRTHARDPLAGGRERVRARPRAGRDAHVAGPAGGDARRRRPRATRATASAPAGSSSRSCSSSSPAPRSRSSRAAPRGSSSPSSTSPGDR